jgi:hypothetical protein
MARRIVEPRAAIAVGAISPVFLNLGQGFVLKQSEFQGIPVPVPIGWPWLSCFLFLGYAIRAESVRCRREH